jgi:acyl-CoA thioesterase-1
VKRLFSKPQKRKIFLQTYGDSLTEGYPYSPAKSWASLLATQLGTGIVISGANGRLIQEMLLEKEEHLEGQDTAYVTLLGGTNDIYLGHDPDDVFLQLKELHHWVEIQGKQPIICLPPPSLDDLIEVELIAYREELRDWSIRSGKPFIDFDYLFRNEKGEILTKLYHDPCHPNEEGYQKMAKQAGIFFKPLFDKWKK